MRYFSALIIIMALVSLAGGCSSAPSATTAPSGTSPAAYGGSSTFGAAADASKTVYASRCAKCHGPNGQGVTGPALAGSGANLGKYNTAQGLLSFMSVSMPFDAPGSLARQDYLNILSWLLVQNSYVSASTTFDPNQLNSIQLTK
jgi:alcohol dehydrogenase (cytochrome c)